MSLVSEPGPEYTLRPTKEEKHMSHARKVLCQGGLATLAAGTLLAVPSAASAQDGGAIVLERACRIITEQEGFGMAHLVFTPSGNAMVVCHGDGTPGEGDQRIELTACRIRATPTTPPLTGECFAMITPSGEVIGTCHFNPSTEQ